MRYCSFCGKSEDKIITMLQGTTGVCACNKCIIAMYDTLFDLDEDSKADAIVYGVKDKKIA